MPNSPANKNNALELRRQHRGLIGIRPKMPVKDTDMLSLVYTPGVARPCMKIAENPLSSYDVTIRSNTVAVISDGSSVYGLGNVGAEAAIPMLEVRSVFHKTFAGIDAVPIALNTQDIDEIVETVRYLVPSFGGIQLDAISAPRCFAIDERLKRAINLPVLHTEQEAVAVGIRAALVNALKLTNKRLDNVKVVVSGAGAAGITIAKMLHRRGVGDIKVCDRHGLLHYDRLHGLNWAKSEVARMTNPDAMTGELADVIKGADVFIGLSASQVITPDMIKSMAKDPIVFPLSISEGEITYEAAKAAGAAVVATGRSDWPNQLSSSGIYPGIFRGALDVRATDITHAMYDSAVMAYAGLVSDDDLRDDNILPGPLDTRPAGAIAEAVARAAIGDNVARLVIDPTQSREKVETYLAHGSDAWVPEVDPGMKNEPTDVQALDLHKRYQGSMEVTTHVDGTEQAVLDSVLAPPHSSEPSRAIAEGDVDVEDITIKNNLVAIVTDGSAVLGLGNIGPTAGLPVMEGKAVLFKTFGGVEAFPICVRTQDPDEIVETVARIAPVFGGVNLEDIAAPNCFEIEEKLREKLDIPIFHDDQHGTAVVVLAGMLNAVKCVNKKLSDIKLVVNGAGASALAVAQLLMKAGLRDIIICDSRGAIYDGRPDGMNRFKTQMTKITNLGKKQGSLEDVLHGADAFLGLSVPGMLTGDMVKTMQPDPIIFALANPTPEIMPDEAKAAGVRVMATGRSDFPNQVNNSLAFPGIFRGAMDVRASNITDDMKLAAARAIAGLITPEELAENKIIPGALDVRVPPAVARAVAHAAIQTGVARHVVDPEQVYQQLEGFIAENQFGEADVSIGAAELVTA